MAPPLARPRTPELTIRYARLAGSDLWESDLLEAWLTSEKRDTGDIPFLINDVVERGAPGEAIINHLIQLVQEQCLDLEFFRDAAESLGRQDILDMVEASLPSRMPVRRGAFGEILIAELVETFHGYRVPVRKLRHTVTGNQTLPGTDILALRWDGTEVQEVCFIESKLRTGRDDGAAAQAYNQLEADSQKAMPIILPFVARQLRGTQPELYRAFKSYLRRRKEEPDLETYGVSLTWDLDSWREQALSRLQGKVDLTGLVVHVIRVKSLAQLIDRVFQHAGVVTSLEEE